MNPHFDPDSKLGKALAEWHNGLDADRGTRAELRRCGSPAAVVMTAEFHRLCRLWQPWLPKERRKLDRLAAVIGLASHLKVHRSGASFARQMSIPKGEGPVISELRFRRLLQQESLDDLYPTLIRILNQLDRSANLNSLAESVFYWGDGTRKKWAYDYYANLPN